MLSGNGPTCHPGNKLPLQHTSRLQASPSASTGSTIQAPSPAARTPPAAATQNKAETSSYSRPSRPLSISQEAHYKPCKEASFLSRILTKAKYLARWSDAHSAAPCLPATAEAPQPDQAPPTISSLSASPASQCADAGCSQQVRPAEVLADVVQSRPARVHSGIPVGKLPLLQQLRHCVASSHQSAMLRAREVENLAAAAIAAAVDTKWVGELWLPRRCLMTLQHPRLIYERPGRCRVFIAHHTDQIPSCTLNCVAVKELVLQLDATAIVACDPSRLAPDAFSELLGLRRVSGRPGCQRLLAWSVVQDAAGASPGAFKLLLVTRHCPGGTLQQLLAQSAQPGGRPVCVHGYLGILLQVTETLAALQAEGIVHGDLKPDNVFLDEGGRPVVADWEGAVRFPAGVRPNAQHEHSPSTMARQYAAHFMRTERYAGLEQLLPEIAAGQADHPLWKLWNHLSDAAKAEMCNSGRMERFVSYSSDVYSLGVMLADASQLCSFERVQPDMRESLALDMFYMASECCHPLPWQRPTMVKLLLRLHTAATAVRCVKSPCPATVASSA